MTSLRYRLKTETDAAHRRLDAELSQLDFSRSEHCGRFFMIHYLGFSRITTEGPCLSAALRSDLVDRLEFGLLQLGLQIPEAICASPVSGLAADYVTLGSRLGAQVLAKRWQRKTLAEYAAAGTYFERDGGLSLWREFCATVDCAPPSGREADRVVADSISLFAGFKAPIDLIAPRATPAGLSVSGRILA